MQNGAQDYLIKGDFSSDSIIRVIQYSIERKQGEAELQKSRQLLHEAERLTHTGAWEWDMESGLLTMSDEWMRIHGVDKRHFTTDELSKIAHPDDVSAVQEAWKAVLEKQSDYNIEHRIIRQNDGQERIIQAYGKLVMDQEGSPEKLIGVASDVTERKEIENNLQAQEDKFKRFFDTNPNATFVWKALDGDFVLTESNEASLEITSGKASNFLGLRASEIYADLPFMVEKLNACYRSKETIRFEHRYKNRSHGTTDWVDFKMAFVEPDTVLHFSEIITERKKAEEQIRFQAHLLEAVEQAVIVTRLDGEIIYWNPFAEQLYGWSAEEAIGCNIINVTVPQISQKQGAEIMAKLGAGQSWSGEFDAQHRDGHTFPAFVSDTPILNEQGELFAIIGISMDITERKQLEIALQEERNLLAQRVEDRTAELRHTNAELMKALQTKDEFLANMSHELRTPLTAILGISEILELGVRGPLNEYQTNSIRTIYESGEHLLSLINDILDLSKIEAGKLEIEPGRVSVEDICQASYSIMKGMAFTKDIELSLHISDPEVVIWADARRLKQILVNLLSNAVKFTPHGGKVSLNVILDKQQNRLKFIVKDNGIGISKEDTDKLFKPFTQLDASLSREYEGTGLGLALVRKLVELHQGEVFVESEGIPGKGSCFTVVLPWENNPAPELAPLSNSSKSVSPDMKIPVEESISVAEKQVVILLAEDNPANMTTMSEYLETFGYNILQAQNGMEAIEKANTDLPDLILMDIQMPEMDGLEAIRRLRQDPKFAYTPIFALTALAMPGDRQRCLDAGATDYITKPVLLKELVKKINACLQSTGQEN